MRFIRFTLENSLLVNLIAILILIGGAMATLSHKREAFPLVDFDVVTVSTWYPGASASEVERFVVEPLEDALKTVSDVKRISGTSIEGFGVISIEIDADAPDASVVVNDIKDAVDSVSDLPDEILDDPKVREINTRDAPMIEISLSGLPEDQLREAAKDLEKRYLDLDDIGAVARKGFRDIEILVEVEPTSLRNYVISLAEISDNLRGANSNIPAGTITTSEEEFLVRAIGETKTPVEVKNVVLRSNDIGQLVRVGDVADVTEDYVEETRIFRTNGNKSINLVIIKKEAGDAITLVEEVNKITETYLASEKYPGLEVDYINDFSFYVKRRLGVLINNAQYGILLVLLCLFLFLSPGISIMTAIGLPIAFAGALAGMYFLGTSINLISMFGLIIVLGIVVDDAIIVSENVFHHAKQGDSPTEAVVKGTGEVMTAVTATILTTVAAFSPLMMMSGIMGKFIRDMPMVVIIALSVSWFEAIVILPSHLLDVLKFQDWRNKKLFKRKPGAVVKVKKQNVLSKAIYWVYEKQLRFFLKVRYLTLAAALVFFGFSMYWAKTKMAIQMFPADGIEIFFVRIQMPMGTDLDTTSKKLAEIETFIHEIPEIELQDFTTDVGINQNDPNDPFSARGSHLGQIAIYLTPESKRERIADEIIEELQEKIDTLDLGYEQLKVERLQNGPPQGKPIAIKVLGNQYEDMLEVTLEMKKRLEKLDGVYELSHDYDVGKTELVVEVDRARAAINSVVPETVAFQVRGAYEGLIATTIKRGDEEIDIRVRFKEETRNSLKSFDQIMIPNMQGRLVPLLNIATVRKQPGMGNIYHRDGDRVITLSGELDESKTSSLEVGTIAQSWVNSIEKKYDGVRIVVSGGFENTKESMESLGKSFLVALFLIFMILAALYHSFSVPIVVLTAIPFALTGVVWSFYLHGMPLSFLGMLGAIGLAGVAVNDAIVLVNFNEALRKKGIPLIDAVVEGSKRRVLPVWLTTITTVVGLMPVAYGWGGFDPFLRPPAIAIGWGLTVATMVTLFIIPTVYSVRFTFVWDIGLAIMWIPKILTGKEILKRPAWRRSELENSSSEATVNEKPTEKTATITEARPEADDDKKA